MKKMINIMALTKKDIRDIIRLEEDSWEPDLRAKKEDFLERLKKFPKGFLGAYLDRELVGMTYGHIISEVKKTWYENSCPQAFNPHGKIFYIVNVGVSKYYRGRSVGSALLDENKYLARNLGINKIVLGARNKKDNLRFYKKNGFVEVEKVINYWSEDKESGGTGIIMEFIL